MKTKFPYDGYEGVWHMLSQYSGLLSKSNIENFNRLTDSLSRAIAPSIAIADIVGRQTALLSQINIPDYSPILTSAALEKHWHSMAIIAEAYRTPEIVSLQNALVKNEFSALQKFADSLKMTHVEAPNLALLKIAPIFEGVSIPKGLSSAIHRLHVDTAKLLINSESVSYDTEDKCFFVEASPDDRATVSETNILCSSLQLLSDIDEADLISFLTQLEKFPAFASEHETGKRIREIVAQWNQYIDFDHEYFYHARSLPEGTCPYTEAQLRQAPTGYTGHGRYNYVGQSHYYFSDVERGAILEVTKHTKDKRVQVAKLRPNKAIRMIDLSSEISTQNKFLEYCRFNPGTEQYPNIKRE